VSDLVKEVSEKDFDAEVLRSDLPVMVDFWAPWCGPCRAMAPLLEGMANNLSGFMKCVKVNVDDANSLAAKYGISSIPTLIVFNKGAEVSRGTGSQDGLKIIQDFVAENYANSLNETKN